MDGKTPTDHSFLDLETWVECSFPDSGHGVEQEPSYVLCSVLRTEYLTLEFGRESGVWITYATNPETD